MNFKLVIGVAIILVLVAAGFWYFTQNNKPASVPVVQNSSVNSSSTNASIPTQNVSVSYNDSDAFNDLVLAVGPMLPIITATSFLNDSNASNVLNGVVSDLTSFESSSNLSGLSDKNFFISYAGAMVELANANKDYLNAMMIQNNQTVMSSLCGNKQTYIRSLFFVNRSIDEIINASMMLNNTLTVFPVQAAEININSTVVLLNNFAQGIQGEELNEEAALNNLKC